MEPMFKLCKILRGLISDDQDFIIAYILVLEEVLFDLFQTTKEAAGKFLLKSLLQFGKEIEF